jgi:hypothetical protein
MNSVYLQERGFATPSSPTFCYDGNYADLDSGEHLGSSLSLLHQKFRAQLVQRERLF